MTKPLGDYRPTLRERGVRPEKRPTAAVDYIDYGGIRITSRYRKWDEFRVMLYMAEACLRVSDRIVTRIDCDSNACSIYSIRITGGEDIGAVIATVISGIAKHYNGGFNGIVVHCDDQREIVLESDWDELGIRSSL